jgi:hypothetical protein
MATDNAFLPRAHGPRCTTGGHLGAETKPAFYQVTTGRSGTRLEGQMISKSKGFPPRGALYFGLLLWAMLFGGGPGGPLALPTMVLLAAG